MIKVDAVPGEFYTTPAYYKVSDTEMANIRTFIVRVRQHCLYADGQTLTNVKDALTELPNELK